jgi:uncharacterized membrane protein YoaT (DUF817 family)
MDRNNLANNPLYEFIIFGIKQARACIFAGSFFVLLFASNYLPLGAVSRYDFLFISAVFLQAVLYCAKIETKDEIKTIFLFHIIGFALEVFKTSPQIGSWSYPEDGFFMLLGVPLYSGFMYAAVGSYIAQSWRIMQLEFRHYPSYWLSIPLAAALYLNFFTHHFIPDFRWLLTALVFLIFFKTTVYFTVIEKRRRLPLTLSFLLIGFFIWIAENIATFLGAWQYPNQQAAWSIVELGKISSWFLLVIISVIIVADLKMYKSQKSTINQQLSANEKASTNASNRKNGVG